MFIARLLTLSFLICFAFQVQAETLEQLSAKSVYVEKEFKYLVKRKTISAYAAQELRCPSLDYWTAQKSREKGMKRAWEVEVSRQMKGADFPKETIKRCLKSGAFVFQGLKLKKHKKNSTYKRFVISGVLAYSLKEDGYTQTMPALVETYRFDDTKTFKAYDSDLSEICSFTVDDGVIKASCKKFGELKGSMVYGQNYRRVARFENSKWRVGFFTNRPPSYVEKNF